MLNRPRHRAFTLVELLVVIGIIAILIAVLVPTISQVRKKSYSTSTRALLAELDTAISTYYNDQTSYPGPFSNTQVLLKQAGTGNDGQIPGTSFGSLTGFDPTKITMAENLTAALVGGLKRNVNALEFNTTLVGNGPISLSALAPKKYTAYITSTSDLSNGQFSDDAGSADDSAIPEFVDRFPGRMPVLYLRASLNPQNSASITAANNGVITSGATQQNQMGSYQLEQIVAYTGATIGEGREQDVHGLKDIGTIPFAYDSKSANPAWAYFNNPDAKRTVNGVTTYRARNENKYILIAAGEDRVYGTADDITNIGIGR